MDEQAVVIGVAGEVRERLAGESSGHDWRHTPRVWKMAERLARGTAANALVVQLAAPLHDIADWKFHDGGETVGPRITRSVLDKYDLPGETIDVVCAANPEIGFKGAGVASEPSTIEARIVQDADRLARGNVRLFSRVHDRRTVGVVKLLSGMPAICESASYPDRPYRVARNRGQKLPTARQTPSVLDWKPGWHQLAAGKVPVTADRSVGRRNSEANAARQSPADNATAPNPIRLSARPNRNGDADCNIRAGAESTPLRRP